MSGAGSAYVRWAKSRAGVPYNLAASGVPPCTADALGIRPEDVAPNGDNLHGWPPLLRRIGARYGVDAEGVALAHGASMANHLVASALLRPGDAVLVERPGYEPHRALLRHLGAEVRTFPRPREEGWRVDVDAVRRRLTDDTRLVLLTNLHNPTGRRTPGAALRELGEMARDRGAHVLVDEVYLEWLHPGGRPTTEGESPPDVPASGSGRRTAARFPGVIATRSLTKAFGLDGLRMGWILAPPAVAARIRRVHDLFSITTAHPSERLAARALDRADVLLERGRERVEANLARVRAFVEGRPDLSWTPPDGGTVCFPRLGGGGVGALVGRLEEDYETTVAPGRFFGAPDHFRLGFGMETEVLEAGLGRLGRALDGS